MNISRRGVVLSGAALGLTAVLPGCASSQPRSDESSPAATSSSAASPSTTGSSSSTVSPSPAPSSQTTTSSPAPPTKSELKAAMNSKYGGKTPSQWGLQVDGVVLRTEGPQVCFTADACGGPNGSGYNAALIDLLITQQIPATLFINKRWAEANPAVFQDLVASPLFEIANHGTNHLPLSVQGKSAYKIAGTASIDEVVDEVWDNHEFLTKEVGTAPRFFRSGTAHYDEIAATIVRDLGEMPVNFDVNADAGATYDANQIISACRDAKPGSILIAHMNQPQSATAEGMKTAFAEMTSRGLTFSTLSDAVTN